MDQWVDYIWKQMTHPQLKENNKKKLREREIVISINNSYLALLAINVWGSIFSPYSLV